MPRTSTTGFQVKLHGQDRLVFVEGATYFMNRGRHIVFFDKSNKQVHAFLASQVDEITKSA